MNSGSVFPKNNTFLLTSGGVILFLLIYGLDYLPLKFEEPRRALVAAEMLISGNFWAPTINGEFYYNKPPLFNWILAGLFKIFGFHDWVERLPTLLSIFGIALTNFFFFRKKIGNEVAALSSLFYVLSGHMLFYFSFQGEIDIAYSFVVFLQIICILHYFKKRNWLPLFFLSYLLMTVGFMMKGLPSIAFQGLTLIGVFVWHKEYKKLFHAYNFLGLFLSLGLLSWYFYLYSGFNNPELVIAKLTVESASRTSDGGSLIAYLVQLGKFPITLIKILLPGCLVILLAKRESFQGLLKNEWVKYIVIFLLFNIPLYWISPGTRDRYLYMFLPFLYNLLFLIGLRSSKSIPIRKIENTLLVTLAVLSLALGFLPFIISGISVLWTVVSILIFICIGFFVKRKIVHVFLGFAFIMLNLRLFYNQVVFPMRAVETKNVAAYLHAEKVIELIGNNSLLFYGRGEETALKIPFRNPVVIQEIERLPYQFSYYYSSKSGKILHWTDQIPKSGYFVTAMGTNEEDFIYWFEKEGISEKAINYSFEMEGRRFSLIKIDTP